jgi:hypothetical protein
MHPFLYPSFYSGYVYSKMKCYVEAAEQKSGIGSDGKKVVKRD